MRLRVFIIVTLALFLPLTARAQGSRKDDIVLNRFGQPVAGASITVCTSGATGTPCSPLASIYSDVALTQPLLNPLTSDGQGNYHFYASPGRYMVQISGAGVSATTIPDVLLPADPTSPSFQSLSVTQNISALNLNLSGNLTVSGGVSSPSTLSAPQQGSAAPVQIGPHWYPGTATGLCSVPAAPAVATETVSSGTGNFSSATTYYVKITLFNRNGQTTASPATAYTPASGSTNRMLVQMADSSYRSGCYGYRVYVSSSGVNGTYYPAQAWTLPTVAFSSLARNAAGLVTAVTTANHGFIPGEQITVSGTSGGSTNFNGTFTLIGQQGSSPTKLFWFQSGGADSGASGGTGTVIAGLGSDSFGHMAPGDFIVATAPTSGSPPPATNTATIDPDQVALNATCNYTANSCTQGGYDVPQGTITGTTPLIVSNQQTVTGVNTGGASGKSGRNCSWTDLNLACIMVMGTANGVRIQGLDIQSACNGIMVTGWSNGFAGSNSFFTNNNITTTTYNGVCAAVRYHSGSWYEQHWIGNYLTGDLADVLVESVSGGGFSFSRGRWNAASESAAGYFTNGFLSVSSVTDPDRAVNRVSFPNGLGLVNFDSIYFIEGGTGTVFECINIGCMLSNLEPADSAVISGTPAAVRFGSDANIGSNGVLLDFSMNNTRFGSGAFPAVLQFSGNNGLGLINITNSFTGAVDFNNIGGIAVNFIGTNVHPWEGASAGKLLNMTATDRVNVQDVPSDGSSDSGWAMHQFMGGIRFCADGNLCVPNVYLETRNYNNSAYGMFWFAGNPATAANQYQNCQFNSGAQCNWLENDGATPLFQVDASNGGRNQVNLCNPSSPANGKINLGCPMIDSTGATVKGSLTATSGSIGGSALTVGSCTSGTVSVTGATTSMAVSVSPAADPGAGFSWMGFVSASGTVTVRLCAIAAGTPTSTTYNVRVIQ